MTTTFVGALRLGGMTAPMVVDGPMKGEIFRAYVGQVLAPSLEPGDIVVMDNLLAHRAPGVRDLIEAAGAGLRYLPPYSPDFNPIEMAFSKLKACLKSSPPGPSTPRGTPSPKPSSASPCKNAPTSSTPQAMGPRDRKLL